MRRRLPVGTRRGLNSPSTRSSTRAHTSGRALGFAARAHRYTLSHAAATCAHASDAIRDDNRARSDGRASRMHILPCVVEVLEARKPPAALLGQRASEPPWMFAPGDFLLVCVLGVCFCREVGLLSVHGASRDAVRD
eukprot:2483710-Pyramimonas_sp.AAC.1